MRKSFVTNGAQPKAKRVDKDLYVTDPQAVRELIKLEPRLQDAVMITEPAAGLGHIANVFKEETKCNVWEFDIEPRYEGVKKLDFLTERVPWGYGNIVTNPPFCQAQEFVERALEVATEGYYIAMFLKLTFLEGVKRRKLFEEHPPIRIWVSSKRITCGRNGEFDRKNDNAMAFAWFVWLKGWKGNTTLGWFN